MFVADLIATMIVRIQQQHTREATGLNDAEAYAELAALLNFRDDGLAVAVKKAQRNFQSAVLEEFGRLLGQIGPVARVAIHATVARSGG